MELKVFELRWTSQGEKEWIAATTNVQAIRKYLEITSMDISDLDDEDEIVELPREEWSKITVRNTEWDKDNPNCFETTTIEEIMKDLKTPDLIAGTNYE